MEVGDFLLCHTCCKMKHNGKTVTTIGRKYRIVDIYNDDIKIFDDEGDKHLFHIDIYNLWFYDKKSLLNKKLKKIKKINIEYPK